MTLGTVGSCRVILGSAAEGWVDANVTYAFKVKRRGSRSLGAMGVGIGSVKDPWVFLYVPGRTRSSYNCSTKYFEKHFEVT